MRTCLPVVALVVLFCSAPVRSEPGSLEASIEELRHIQGEWLVATEFLNEDGSVANRVEGTYEFNWVVPDRVLQGHSAIPALDMRSAILFYVRESDSTIEMVSVGKDGKLWVMTGPAGGDTRYTEPFVTQSGGEGQLRFTRYNVTEQAFESRMEWTQDGGETWVPGNHQVFRRP